MGQNEGFSRDVVMDLHNASSSKCRLGAGLKRFSKQGGWAKLIDATSAEIVLGRIDTYK